MRYSSLTVAATARYVVCEFAKRACRATGQRTGSERTGESERERERESESESESDRENSERKKYEEEIEKERTGRERKTD